MSKSFLNSIFLSIFFLSLSSVCLAAKDGDVAITQVFKHRDGFTIIQTKVFVEGVWFTDHSHYPAGFFWSRGDDHFFQIHQIDKKIERDEQLRLIHAIRFPAPTMDQHHREASLNLTLDIFNAFGVIEEINVVCESQTACFKPAGTDVRDEMNERLKRSQITLQTLPEVAKIKWIVKMPSRANQTYYIFEVSRFDESFGKPATNVLKSIDGDLEFIASERIGAMPGEVSFRLENGDELSVTLATGQANLFMREWNANITLHNIPQTEMTPALFDKIGLPTSRYEMPLLASPCEGLWSSQEKL